MGIEYMQASTIGLSDDWENHWNLGFTHYPEAKFSFSDKRRTLNEYRFGSSFVYLHNESLNFLVEGFLEANEKLNLKQSKEYENFFTLNSGLRTSMDVAWKETQIVPELASLFAFTKKILITGSSSIYR